jgi:hypothetical protein
MHSRPIVYHCLSVDQEKKIEKETKKREKEEEDE